MDACHLLPKVSHNGFKNTHSLIKFGVRIVLAPMKLEVKFPKIGNSFLIGSQVIKPEKILIFLKNGKNR